MIEIGSEFEFASSLGKNTGEFSKWIPEADDSIFTFCGRTALEIIADDLLEKQNILFPSYCCHSMIEPFLKKGFTIDFYDVFYNKEFTVNLQIPSDCNVLVWCNYFGYDIPFDTATVADFQKRGGIIIEDITHSLFSEKQTVFCSDYFVASLRKWGPLLCGGLCLKRNGHFSKRPALPPDEVFLNAKHEAMRLKQNYISSPHEYDKNKFLELFSTSNQWLAQNYSNLIIDEESRHMLFSWPIDEIRQTRQKNAIALHNELKKTEDVIPLFPEKQIDCPLFVPVIIPKEKRSKIRQNLIKNNIYCPIHWPKPDDKCNSNLYETELSLICDQRYAVADMQRIADIIKNEGVY